MPDKRSKNDAFGMRVRVAMAAARVSRLSVAKECGISAQAVQRWCDGTAMPSSANLVRFCQITGCSLEWLMWPHEVDLRTTDWAINGEHIKNIVRATIDQMER